MLRKRVFLVVLLLFSLFLVNAATNKETLDDNADYYFVNIRADTKIGEDGGYLWAKIQAENKEERFNALLEPYLQLEPCYWGYKAVYGDGGWSIADCTDKIESQDEDMGLVFFYLPFAVEYNGKSALMFFGKTFGSAYKAQINEKQYDIIPLGPNAYYILFDRIEEETELQIVRVINSVNDKNNIISGAAVAMPQNENSEPTIEGVIQTYVKPLMHEYKCSEVPRIFDYLRDILSQLLSQQIKKKGALTRFGNWLAGGIEVKAMNQLREAWEPITSGNTLEYRLEIINPCGYDKEHYGITPKNSDGDMSTILEAIGDYLEFRITELTISFFFEKEGDMCRIAEVEVRFEGRKCNDGFFGNEPSITVADGSWIITPSGAVWNIAADAGFKDPPVSCKRDGQEFEYVPKTGDFRITHEMGASGYGYMISRYEDGCMIKSYLGTELSVWPDKEILFSIDSIENSGNHKCELPEPNKYYPNSKEMRAFHYQGTFMDLQREVERTLQEDTKKEKKDVKDLFTKFVKNKDPEPLKELMDSVQFSGSDNWKTVVQYREFEQGGRIPSSVIPWSILSDYPECNGRGPTNLYFRLMEGSVSNYVVPVVEARLPFEPPFGP